MTRKEFEEFADERLRKFAGCNYERGEFLCHILGEPNLYPGARATVRHDFVEIFSPCSRKFFDSAFFDEDWNADWQMWWRVPPAIARSRRMTALLLFIQIARDHKLYKEW